MKARRFFLIIAVACAARGEAGTDLASEIEALVEAEMASSHVAGAVVGVWRAGQPVTVFARGFSDVGANVPLTVNDHLRIASITKTFTTTRVLQLEEAGLLSLSDPIGNYVPGLVNGSATLRQLGDMTAGFFNYTADPVFLAESGADPLRVWTPSELVALANAHGPRFAPGTAWEYSNTHTALLQMVIEQVTGRTLAAEYQSAFFTPLSLDATSYPSTADLPDPYAAGYFVNSATGETIPMPVFHPSIAGGAGAIISTLDDVRVWTEALGRGDLLTPASQTERLVMNPAADGYDAYGFGIARIGEWIGHDGVYPGYQSIALYDPAQDQTIVILANSTFTDGGYHFPYEAATRIAPLLVPEPSTWALLAAAAGGLAARRWRVLAAARKPR